MPPTATPKENVQFPRFLLLYGSATGQAQAIAEEIAEKAPAFGLSPHLLCLEMTGKRFNIEDEKCIVVITSTTGDGDPPGNAEKFVRRLKKRTLGSDYLAHLHYALLGLGDQNYSNFCRCGKDMDARFLELGAKQFYPTGFADDGVGLEVVAEPWLEGLYPALQKFLGVNSLTLLTEQVEALSIVPSESGDANPAQNKLNSGKIFQTEAVSTNNNSLSTNNNSVDHSNEVKNHEVIISNSFESSPTKIDFTDDRKAAVISDLSSLKQQKEFFDSARTLETPCRLLDISTEDYNLSPLFFSDNNLLEKSLTVPVYPPDFLKAEFSANNVKLQELSHQNDLKLPCAASSVLRVKVTDSRVLTHPDALKKSLLVSLDLKECDMDYRPGDSISVICYNSCSEVDMLLDRLGVSDSADLCMTLTVIPDTKKRRASVPAHITPVTTLRHALTTACNIRETPTKALIRVLLEYTSQPKEIRRMQELCSKEGAQIYTSVVREKRVSLLDFLFAFPSCRPPLERILEHLPRLQPRPYSACSCSQVDKDRLDFVFNVVDLPGRVQEARYFHRRGVCTGWLDDITNGIQAGESEQPIIEIPIFLRTNQHFRPPSDLSQPLIMIGPGTGVAPFIGFLRERQYYRQQMTQDEGYGETWLVYGCRHSKRDFLFKEELQQFESDETLSCLCVALSREEPLEDDKALHCRYVQDYLRRLSSDVAQLLCDKDALVYVCGDATGMAKEVSQAFEYILKQEKGLSDEDANMFIMKKRIHKTYLEDVWT